MLNLIQPNRHLFAQDPGGYSRSAWMLWAMLAEANGMNIAPSESPTSNDLKNPVLWLTQAEAMTQAAAVLVRNEPSFDNMPIELRGICDSQYCAVALMLVGYSLEVCLKAMIIIRVGIEAYAADEAKARNKRTYHHHDLRSLADFLSELNTKDQAILEMLSHFVYWAGRYPDPGAKDAKDINKHEKIFELAEAHKISAHDLFGLAAKVMKHVRTLTEKL